MTAFYGRLTQERLIHLYRSRSIMAGSTSDREGKAYGETSLESSSWRSFLRKILIELISIEFPRIGSFMEY